MTRLRLNNSMLNGDRFRYNLIADPSCECGYHNESVVHYLSDCPLYTDLRHKLLQKVRDCISPGVNPTTFANWDKKYSTQILLKGSEDYHETINITIAHAVQSYITASGRF